MGVSYSRLWKMLIDKNMKRVEIQYLAGISLSDGATLPNSMRR